MLTRCYIAVSARDARLARICIASIRTFHPDLRVSLLPGGPLPPSLTAEARRYWNVDLAPIPTGDYGWGFVKLEPLFSAPGETFLMLDADTVLTGPIADTIAERFAVEFSPDFIVDEEEQPEAEMRRLYYDWDTVRSVDPTAQRPIFVFNSGQWAGRPGVLAREDFTPFLDWSLPRKLRFPECFFNGDQGLMNFVLHRKVTTDLITVERQKLMHWPGHGMEAFNLATILKGTAPCRIIHWAGLKCVRLSAMPGADLLDHFERIYYQRIPAGWILRPWRAATSTVHELIKRFRIWVKLFWKLKVCRSQKTPTSDAKIQ